MIFDVCVYNRACLCMCISRIDEIRVFQIRLFFFFQEFREASYWKEVGCFLILINTIYIRRISRYLSISRIEILKCKEYSYKIKSFKIISKNKNLTEKENYYKILLITLRIRIEINRTVWVCEKRERERERDGERKQENPAFLRSYKIFLIGLTPPPPGTCILQKIRKRRSLVTKTLRKGTRRRRDGRGLGLVAVHDSAASWARGFSVRPRKWRRW